MIESAAVLFVGVAVLWVGGEQFVLGTTRLAERLGIPTILVGMIVAGFGTSAPELTVSVLAQVRGEGEVALGNALGSNVANVLLVLPVAALAATWTARGDLLRREILSVLAATALTLGLVTDGRIVRAEAALLVVSFVVLMTWLTTSALRNTRRKALEQEIEELIGPDHARLRIGNELVRTALGLAVVLVSADRLVWGASRIARELGISEAVIGLTVVAVGTSLPEAVTGLVAARRGEPDLVLGNVLGSNLFNALLIVGIGGLIGPLGIGGASRWVAIAGVGASTALVATFLLKDYRLTRRQAVVWLVGYIGFVAALYANR
jgi:cation:H+ antiporter